MGNVNRSATPLLRSHLFANVEGKQTYDENTQAGRVASLLARPFGRGEAVRFQRDGHSQNGSLTEAVHLSKNNAGIPTQAHRERKSRAEHKGKSPVDRNH